jgi:hypothetical protein
MLGDTTLLRLPNDRAPCIAPGAGRPDGARRRNLSVRSPSSCGDRALLEVGLQPSSGPGRALDCHRTRSLTGTRSTVLSLPSERGAIGSSGLCGGLRVARTDTLSVLDCSRGNSCLSAWRRPCPGRAREEPAMAHRQAEPGRPRTAREVPHDALKRVDRRVKQILARQAAVLQARRAAERLKAPAT